MSQIHGSQINIKYGIKTNKIKETTAKNLKQNLNLKKTKNKKETEISQD